MTTTEHLLKNERYAHFSQSIFHAGDEEQFEQYRYPINGDICIPQIDLSNNIFSQLPCVIWNGYKKLEADSVLNTFRYIFHKFKKGIFVKIMNNKLKVFLPFSKVNFINEWGDRIHVDKSKYKSVTDFIRYISNMEGRHFKERSVNENTSKWYANNCLVRYEFPLSEGDSNVENVKNMLEELCSKRIIPDIEFFVNRRDFPILTNNNKEPYYHIWDKTDQDLVSHSYEKYLPIFSMSKTNRYADILMPTWDDWSRIQSEKSIFFEHAVQNYTETFDIPWDKKKQIAIFRGASTGCGVDETTNIRLQLFLESLKGISKENGEPYIDASITKWNIRPRKLQGQKYLQTIDIEKYKRLGVDIYTVDSKGNHISNKLTPKQQSEYKYIIHVEGHVSAFRLSLELSMGSVILLVESDWNIWYSNLLEEGVHYISIKKDLSNLISTVEWCINNDEKCRTIANNARLFFDTYLQKDGILDYMQKTIIDLKNEMGVYLYNSQSPLDFLIKKEYEGLDYSVPTNEKSLDDLTRFPIVSVGVKNTYGILQGVEWVIRKIILEQRFDLFINKKQLFSNKLSVVNYCTVANFPLAIKSTLDSKKRKEHIHESFVGIKVLNELSKAIPNFCYIFGLYHEKDTYNVISEFIKGETLHEYIKGKTFSFKEFLFIVLQICLALQVAQNTCGFVHYDLCPWNIILNRTEKKQTVDYILSYDRVIRIYTNVIPVLIDFGKSHVIHDGIHHGFINMFKISTIQDVITLLIKSADQIIAMQDLKDEFSHFLHLMNFISETTYCPTKFISSKSVKSFLENTRKYSSLIESNKYELENKTPFDLIKYIMLRKAYRFDLGNIKEYEFSMDKGNGIQVFDYSFSRTVNECIKSYVNVFSRLKQCTLPIPNNLFLLYYVIQMLEKNLHSIYEEMILFLTSVSIPLEPYEKIYQETMSFLKRVYMEKITHTKPEKIRYLLTDSCLTFIECAYTEQTFLNPKKIISLLSTISIDKIDILTEYKQIIETVLLYKGTYKLSETDRTYYLENFKELFQANNINMMNAVSNEKTLSFFALSLYRENRTILEQTMITFKGNCDDALMYLELYKQMDS
jgi:hypothetical protein